MSAEKVEGPWIECKVLGICLDGKSTRWFLDVKNPNLLGPPQQQRDRMIKNLEKIWAWDGLVPETEDRPAMRMHFVKPESM